jgi:hypothetical protein
VDHGTRQTDSALLASGPQMVVPWLASQPQGHPGRRCRSRGPRRNTRCDARRGGRDQRRAAAARNGDDAGRRMRGQCARRERWCACIVVREASRIIREAITAYLPAAMQLRTDRSLRSDR